jgi:nicotinic acid phosphoribosyltransferase
MAYAYWKSGRIHDSAVFDLYFRKNPFQGEFTIFAGLEECLKFFENFNYSDSGKFSIAVAFLLHLSLRPGVSNVLAVLCQSNVAQSHSEPT